MKMALFGLVVVVGLIWVGYVLVGLFHRFGFSSAEAVAVMVIWTITVTALAPKGDR